MTRAVVVINPLAGRGRRVHDVRAHADLARDALAARNVDAAVHATTAAGDARRLAAQAVRDQVDLVVAWGGDGTVNEVASAVVGTGVALAIVPAGSGNGLASDLAIPRLPRAALAVAAGGVTRRIDAGRVDESWFFNIAGVGIDALIAARFAELGMHRRGPLAYLKLGLREIPRFRPERYTVVADGERVEREVLILAVANGRQYGNRVLIAPRARVDDGLFDLVLAGPLSVWGVISRLPSLFLGSLQPDRDVTMTRVSTVTIARPGDILYHVDGEPRRGRDSLTVELVHHALLVRVPAL